MRSKRFIEGNLFACHIITGSLQETLVGGHELMPTIWLYLSDCIEVIVCWQ